MDSFLKIPGGLELKPVFNCLFDQLAEVNCNVSIVRTPVEDLAYCKNRVESIVAELAYGQR